LGFSFYLVEMASTTGQQAPAPAMGWWGHFTEAVVGVFREWTALRLAASKALGTGDAEKLNEMAKAVLEGFSKRCIYKDELEDYFDDYFQNEFQVIIEDGSIEEVSALLQMLYEECRAGDFRRAMMLAARSRSTAESALAASHAAGSLTEMAPAQRSENRAVRAQQAMADINPEDLEGDGEDDEDGEEGTAAAAGDDDDAMMDDDGECRVPEFDVIPQEPLTEEEIKRQERKKKRAAARRAAKKAGPVIDADGFMLVR